MKRIISISMRPVCKNLIYGLIFLLIPLSSFAQPSSWPSLGVDCIYTLISPPIFNWSLGSKSHTVVCVFTDHFNSGL